MTQMTKQKHADSIIQWALGHPIEVDIYGDNVWRNSTNPSWNENYKYRVKQDQPKPDIVVYANVDEYLANDFKHNAVLCGRFSQQREFTDNIKVTYNGETGKLIAIEMIEQE